VLADYHLRVGEITFDSHLPAGMTLKQQRTDETEVGRGPMATIITAKRLDGHPNTAAASAADLGLDLATDPALIEWDVYDAVLAPGDLALMLVWKDAAAAESFVEKKGPHVPASHRVRNIRIVRDYTMEDRREAPQYYPQVQHRG